MEGKVKWYNFKKGFGFIQAEDEKDYFVHYTQVPKGVTLKDNDKVTFEVKETDKGLQATNIQLVK